MSEDLKPCPFCGGEAEVHPSSDWNTRFSGKTFFVWCDKCETRGDYYNSEAEAVAAWNARAERTCEMTRVKQFPGTDCNFVCWICSVCGRTNDEHAPNYCPNCGARVIVTEAGE